MSIIFYKLISMGDFMKKRVYYNVLELKNKYQYLPTINTFLTRQLR